MIKRLLLTSTGGTVGRLIIEMIRETLPTRARIIAADAHIDVSYMTDLVTPAKLPEARDPGYNTAIRTLIAKEEIDSVLPMSEE